MGSSGYMKVVAQNFTNEFTFTANNLSCLSGQYLNPYEIFLLVMDNLKFAEDKFFKSAIATNWSTFPLILLTKNISSQYMKK